MAPNIQNRLTITPARQSLLSPQRSAMRWPVERKMFFSILRSGAASPVFGMNRLAR